jgi:hypothetical protein
VLRVHAGPGANCSSAGSAIDVLFYGSLTVAAVAVALVAWLPPRERESEDLDEDDPGDDGPTA